MLRIHVLGGAAIWRDGAPLTGAVVQPRRLAVLALLARAGPRGATRDRLASLVWPDASEEQGRRALTQALYALRRELGAEDVIVGVQDLRLNPQRVAVDLWDFEAALAAGDAERAAGCYTGPFLEGFRVPGADELERWCDAERAALARRHAEALAALARRAEEAGDLDAAVGWWRRRAACDPLEARVALHLMTALAAAGDRAAAVQHGRIYETLVQEELGIQPDPAVGELMERLRAVGGTAPATSTEAQESPADRVTDASAPATRPADAPLRSAPPRVARPRMRQMAAAALALSVGLLALAGAWAFRAPPAADPPVLVIGPIRDHTASADSGLAAVVPDLLATSLGRTAALQVISPERAHALTRQAGDPAASLRAAASAGATQLIEGSLYRTPAGLRLDLRRIELSSGRQLEALTVEGDDIFALVNRGTDRLMAGMGVPASPGNVAGLTTRSQVAYRFYVEGVRAFYRDDRRTAVRMLDAALAEDSAFAMAEYYRALADPGDWTASLERLNRARRLAVHATDRERLLIQARWAHHLSSPELRTAAETLAARYPHEVEGHFLTGLARLMAGEYLEAVGSLERAVALDSLQLRGPGAVCHGCEAFRALASVYLLLDSAGAAERAARRWVAAQPGSGAPYLTLAAVLENRGRPDEALAAYRAAVARGAASPPEWLFLAQHRIRHGDYAGGDAILRGQEDATAPDGQVDALWFLAISLRQQGRQREALAVVREARERQGSGPPSAAARLLEAQVLLEQGDLRGALARFDSVARIPLPDAAGTHRERHRAWALTHAAGVHARLGDTAALTQLADRVQALGARSAASRDRRLHHYVRGLLWQVRGREREAIAEFRRAWDSPTHGYTRINLELGRLLLAQGKPQEAATVLEPALRGSLEGSNLYVTRTELHELLARAWTAAGRRERALPHLRAVDAAWARADPPFAERRSRLLAELGPRLRTAAGAGPRRRGSP